LARRKRRKYNRSVYFLYSLLLLVVLILSTPWWVLEMVRHGKYRSGWRERLGRVPERVLDGTARGTVWIHAVSVGEVLAISRVIAELKARLPGRRIVISTTTDTGQRLARERFGKNNVFYFPLDLPWAVRNYLNRLQPRLVVLAESEFWPNLLRWARLSGARVAVVNARVSDRSLPRYLRFRPLGHRVMRNIDLFLAQSPEDADRLVRIGAPADRVEVSGNLKFEVKPAAKSELAGRLQSAIARAQIGPVIVAGSTLEGEEKLLLEMYRRVLAEHSSAMLLLAPRHPQRFDAVATLIAQSGLPWERRSQWDGQRSLRGRVFLLDSIGELSSLYALADLAFIGGSLVPRGGHNVLEAAQFGLPILVGPYTQNFRDIIGIFCAQDALRVVTPESLAKTVLELLQDEDQRVALGQRALAVLRSQQGATERTVQALLRLLPEPRIAVSSASTAEKHA
jgi:3-deoxy-D-manno-octulosonic-acid transferase